MSSFAALTIVASSLLGQAADQPPGAEQLKEFGDMVVGKWVGESTLDFALPGICEKGDKLIVSSTTEWILDGTSLLTRAKYDVNGKTVGEAVILAGWDMERKGIRTRAFGTLGGTSGGMWKKQGGKWRHRVQGILPGDVKHSAVVILTIVDADTHISKATQRKMRGEELPDDETEVKRVK